MKLTESTGVASAVMIHGHDPRSTWMIATCLEPNSHTALPPIKFSDLEVYGDVNKQNFKGTYWRSSHLVTTSS